ncbi:MAG: hypothetical protein IPK50_13915 [Fibrobacterota bacterium]|nr:MAG: hypothetical protein IPK50_13915 [Fibrobacterota bacterium]
MKSQLLDTLVVGGIIFDILDAVGGPLFTDSDIGLPRHPWVGCPKGIAVSYRFHANYLSLMRVSIGLDGEYFPQYLRARDPKSGALVKLPEIDNHCATVSECVVTWERLRRPIHFTGTMVIGCGNMPDDFHLQEFRVGSTQHTNCFELTFCDGRLLKKEPCVRERAFQLRAPEDQLMYAVRDETCGEGLMAGLLRHVLDPDWTEACKCRLSATACGPISSYPLDEVLAHLIDQRACDDESAHPLAHLHGILSDARAAPKNRGRKKPPKYEQILADHIGTCKCLQELEHAIATSREWPMSETGVCWHRMGQQACPRRCAVRSRLEQLRSVGSQIRSENLVRHELGCIPFDCMLVRESSNGVADATTVKTNE